MLDSDDYYWMPSDPPFTRKRNVEQRKALLAADAPPEGRWMVSGSMLGWGDFLMPSLDLVVYLWKPADIRRDRLTKREREHFGPAVDPGGSLNRQMETFLDWACEYDSGGMGMRSRMSEEEWMARLSCPVLRLEGDISVDEEVSRVLSELDALGLA
jgi:hypothetical protein